MKSYDALLNEQEMLAVELARIDSQLHTLEESKLSLNSQRTQLLGDITDLHHLKEKYNKNLAGFTTSLERKQKEVAECSELFAITEANISFLKKLREQTTVKLNEVQFALRQQEEPIANSLAQPNLIQDALLQKKYEEQQKIQNAIQIYLQSLHQSAYQAAEESARIEAARLEAAKIKAQNFTMKRDYQMALQKKRQEEEKEERVRQANEIQQTTRNSNKRARKKSAAVDERKEFAKYEAEVSKIIIASCENITSGQFQEIVQKQAREAAEQNTPVINVQSRPLETHDFNPFSPVDPLEMFITHANNNNANSENNVSNNVYNTQINTPNSFFAPAIYFDENLVEYKKFIELARSKRNIRERAVALLIDEQTAFSILEVMSRSNTDIQEMTSAFVSIFALHKLNLNETVIEAVASLEAQRALTILEHLSIKISGPRGLAEESKLITKKINAIKTQQNPSLRA